jgi:hypothetical protein
VAEGEVAEWRRWAGTPIVEMGYFSGPEEGQEAQTRSKFAHLGTLDWKS